MSDPNPRFPSLDSPPPPLRPELLDAAHAAGPARPLWPRGGRLAIAAAVGALSVGLDLPAALQSLPARGLPGWWWWSTGLAWAGLALWLGWLALGEADPRVPVWGGRRLLVALVGIAAFAGVNLLTERWLHGALQGPSELPGFWEVGLRCWGRGVAVELVPLALLFVLVARGFVARPVRAGALAGLAAGAWGLLAQQLHCASPWSAHNLLFHLGVGLSFALAGALLGWWWGARPARFGFPPGPEGR